MEAFTYFFVELALWNILLATLAFLFGLLMGHWIWGHFKKKLVEAKSNGLAKEKEVSLLSEDVATLREKNRDLEKEAEEDKKMNGRELKTVRRSLEKERTQKEEAIKEVGSLKKELTEDGEKRSQLEERVKVFEKEKQADEEKQKEVEDKLVESQKKVEEVSQNRDKEQAALKEKLEKAESERSRLEKKVAKLNENEEELKFQIEIYEEEIADLKKEDTKQSEEG